MKYKHIDPSFFESFYESNNEFKCKMVTMFIEKAPAYMNDMQQYVEQKSWNDLAAAAHKFMSCIGFVGASSLREATAEINKIAKEHHNVVSLPKLVTNLKNICNEVISELEAELNTFE